MVDSHTSVGPYLRNQTARYKMEYRLQSMYNHMVGRTASVISPFYSLLPGLNRRKDQVLVGFKLLKSHLSY